MELEHRDTPGHTLSVSLGGQPDQSGLALCEGLQGPTKLLDSSVASALGKPATSVQGRALRSGAPHAGYWLLGREAKQLVAVGTSAQYDAESVLWGASACTVSQALYRELRDFETRTAVAHSNGMADIGPAVGALKRCGVTKAESSATDFFATAQPFGAAVATAALSASGAPHNVVLCRVF